jgi:hypothetical protein
MSKRSNVAVEKQLKYIGKNLNELSEQTKLNEILKQYSDTQKKIELTDSQLKSLKQTFDDISTDENKQKNIIDEETYERYISDVDDLLKEMENDSIENQIDLYKKIVKKTSACKKYLQSKKMSIIECDPKEQTKENTKESVDENTKENTTNNRCESEEKSESSND